MLKILVALVAAAMATDAAAYIDPQTTQTVVSGLGALLASIGAVFVLAGAILRHYAGRIVAGFKLVMRRPLVRRYGGYAAALLVGGILTVSINHLFRGESTMQLSAGQRVGGPLVIIGIDGMDPKVTQQLLDSGKMPHFARLAARGDFKPLMTVNPVQSPVVWATMATGVGPGIHGISDFITRKEKSYVPELSLVKRLGGLLKRPQDLFAPPVDPKLFFWEQLVAKGVSAKVLRWPLTFPATGDATILSGLGTPDLLGGMGTYTLFTTDRTRFPAEVKGAVVPLSFDRGKAKTSIHGPRRSGIWKDGDSTVDMELERAGDQLRLAVGGTSLTLIAGQLSDWVPLAFPIGLGSKMTGMAQFLAIEIGADVHLYMSPLQIDPLHPAYPLATDTYAKDLARDVGRFHTLGLAEDTNALADEIIDEDQFLKICASIMDESEEVFFHELATGDTKFFSFVFDTLDRIQHMFWRFRDPQHPLYDAGLAAKYGSVIESYYVRMDQILGKAQARLGDDVTLLVVSDHGFTSYRRNFHANSWLIENGYMTLVAGRHESDGLFRDVDWSKTRAFALGFSQIFINVKGRDEKGVVPPAEVEALKKEIAQKLATVVDPGGGNAVVRVYDATEVYGSAPPMGPDLLVGMESGYRFSWQTAVGGAPSFVFEDNDKRWSGDHCVDPEHVPGVIFSSRKLALTHPSVFDVAPTTLAYFGVDVPARMAGKNLFDGSTRHASTGL